MAALLRDIILNCIDETLDVDDLENIGDYILSVITVENLGEWQMTSTLRQLHADLADAFASENDHARRLRIKAALTYFEVDFSDYLITKETDSLPVYGE